MYWNLIFQAQDCKLLVFLSSIGSAALSVIIDNLIMQMKGERKMLERLLQTEIAMLRAIRDGSALMQHMEDFYYIALLEVSSSFTPS